MQQMSGSQSDSGAEYRNKVITYAAINLSLNQNVEDFVIHSKRKAAGLFDDVIIKVKFKEELHPYIYLIKTKYVSKEKPVSINKNIKNLFDSYEQVISEKNNNKIFESVPDGNVMFGFFCTNKLEENTLRRDFSCDIIKRNNANIKIFPFGNRNICSSQLHLKVATKYKAFFDHFYLYFEQPRHVEIMQEINKLCKTVESDSINDYVLDYFQIPELRKNGLSKKIFETQLLKLHISNYIVTPTEIVSIHQEQAKIWNKITLEHDITLIDDTMDIERSLFGCFENKVNQLVQNTLEWNHSVKNLGKLDQISIDKFKEISQNLGARQWTSAPGTVKTLVEELWACDQLPLILRVSQPPSILEEYQHLNKRFIIIGDFKRNNYNVTNYSSPKIFVNVDSICLDSLKDELLQKICVSLQGHTPVRLYDIVDNDKNCLINLTCSLILSLIRNRKVHLKEECLENSGSMVFVIEDQKSKLAVNIDEIEPNEYNTYEIHCRSYEVQRILKQIGEASKYKYHSIIHLRKSTDAKLEFLNGDKRKLGNYFIDENGDDIYCLDVGEAIPIIGRRLDNREQLYIPRYFRKAIIHQSIFKTQEKRVCFISGDVDSLDLEIGTQIIHELSDLQNKLDDNQNILIDERRHPVGKYWDVLSTKQCPLFHVKVVDGVMVLLKYKNCNNMNAYLSYSEKVFEESAFFTELTGKMTVISGEPGIGKSSLIRSLSEMQDEKNYTLICNLAEYRDVLKIDNEKLYENPLDFICNKFETSTFKEFMKAVFKYHKDRSKLVLFIDAFDEVLPAHKKAVLHFMESLAKSHIQIIVASRLFFDTLLINNFEVQPVQIDSLRREDSEGYFKSQGLSDVKINDIPDELLTNPLFLTFFCFLFREGALDYTKLNRFDIFKNVLTKKIERYYHKSNRVFSTSLEAYTSNVLNIHKVLALVVVFGEEVTIGQDIIEDYDESVRLFKGLNIKLGIVKYFNGDYAVFLHQSFAEFLAAEWLSEKLLEEDFEEPTQAIYRRMILECDRNVRYFFDNMVCEDNKFHRAVLQGDMEMIRKLADEDPDIVGEIDKCGRYALVLAASYCYDQNYEVLEEVALQSYMVFPEDFDRSDLFMKWNWTQFLNGLSKECFFDRACGENLSVTVFLYLVTLRDKMITSKNILSACENFNLDLAYSLLAETKPPVMEYYDTVMDMCLKRGRTNIICGLIARKYGLGDISLKYDNASEPLHFAEAIVKETNGEFTALHVACMIGNKYMVMELLQIESEKDSPCSSIYTVDVYGNIPICYAIMQGNIDILSSLFSKMNDLSFRDTEGNTLLHLSCRHLNEGSIQTLLNGFLDVSERNFRGQTALHTVASLDWRELREIGIAIIAKENGEAGNDPVEEHIISMANHSGSYHISEASGIENACRIAASIVLNILMDYDAEILEQDNDGNTALHTAYLHSNWFVFEYLIDKSKKIAFIRNKNGMSVFDFAKRDGKLKMLENLLNKSVSVDAFTTNTLEDSSADDDAMPVEEDAELEDIAEAIDSNIITGFSLLTIEEHSSIKNDLKFVEGRGWTLLHKATEDGRSHIIKFLVDKGYPTDAPDDEGYIPLHFVRCENDVHLLLDKQKNLIDINRKSHNSETPLHTASRNVRLDVVRTLLSLNADCTIKNVFGQTALHIAILANNVEIVKMLVDHGANVNEPNKGGATPVHLATSECNTSLVVHLLDNDADSTLQDDIGNTPLHLACQYGFMPVVEILVDRSPQVITFCNKKGHRPYDSACIEGKHVVAEYFIKNCIALNPRISRDILHGIVGSGHLKILEVLFEKGILTRDDLECKGKDDNTLLHIATMRDHTDVVRFLLEKGVKVNPVNIDLYTPLHVVSSGDCARLLYSRYENVSEAHATSKYGETPLHTACASITINVVEFFLNRDYDVSCKDIVGWTPLHLAVSASAFTSAEALLDKGANVNERNKYSATPLHIASTKSSVVLETLLARDADITMINEHGDFAVDRKKQLSYESQSEKKEIEITSYNVLDMACSKGEYGVVKYLIKECPAVKRFKLAVKTLFNIVIRGDLWCLRMLLDENIIREDDLKCTKPDGSTLIHTAANCGNIKMVRFLEEKGLQLSTLNNVRTTPLEVAIYMGHGEVLQHLLQVSKAIKDKEKWTALEGAVYGSNIKLLEMLLEHGVDVNTRMSSGSSVLHSAVVAGSLPLVRSLIKYKVNIELVDKSGYTAFDVACIMNRCYIITCLLGAFPMLRESRISNKTIFAMVTSGSLKSLKLLLDEDIIAGDDLHISDECLRTLLHVATFRGHTDVIRFLLQKGVKANPLDCEDHTPLHLARSAEDAKLLIAHYENSEYIHGKTITGCTPLHAASYSGFTDVVQVLLDAKADVFATMEDGSTPLHVAAEKNENVNIVSMLLQHQAPVNYANKTLKTALHIATSFNALGVVHVLVNHGANVELKDEDADTALHLACKKDHLKIVEYLTNFLVSTIYLRNKYEFTPFHYACLLEHTDVIEYFLKNYSYAVRQQLSDDVLYGILDQNQLVSLKLILDYNIITRVDLDKPLHHGYTPLHLAVFKSCTEMITFLLQNGVRVNPADEDGMRPIHYVNTAEDAELLLDYYENPSGITERSHIGRTPLHTASKDGYADIITLFLLHQAEVSVRDTTEWTPLLLAAYADEVECVRILLQHGADVNEANDHSETAFHLAVQNGSWSMIDVLLDNGADVKLKDRNDNTVLHSVLMCYRWNAWFVESPIHDSEVARDNVMELVDVLLERGVDPFEVNCDGESAIDIVKKLELPELLQKMSYKRRRLNENVGVT